MEALVGGRRLTRGPAAGLAGSASAAAADGTAPRCPPRGEAVAAAFLKARTGMYCRKWAPPGEPFEFKYSRADAVMALSEAPTEEAEALEAEIRNRESEILTGPLRGEDLRAALEESLAGEGSEVLRRLLSSWEGCQ